MRKFLALFFALLLIVLLVGCNSLKHNDSDTAQNSDDTLNDNNLNEVDSEGATESNETQDTITDIADWDSLPWIQTIHEGWKPAVNAYNFINNLVSGQSDIPEYNDLGIKDYAITLLEDGESETILRFTFTVTGNSLPETLPPGTYTWTIYHGMDVWLYDGDIPRTLEELNQNSRKNFGLDAFGDHSAVQAVHAYLTMMPWQISPHGEWDISNGILPSNYICKFYGDENMEISFEDMQSLLSEKFGITVDKPTENCRFYRCEYNKETNTVRYTDTRGYEAVHRILDFGAVDGTAYVTVQLYADRLYLIPSHKITYKIGEGEVFLVYEIVEVGKYEPNALR